MTRRILAVAVAAIALAATTTAPPPAAAQDCQVGQGLGSTLLIPYFEVDTTSALGVTTLFSVNNESSTETLVRVVLWTDWGIPTLGFDVYLVPRDLQSFNVRDLLNGFLPSTGDGKDLSAFNFCNLVAFAPIYPNPALTVGERNTVTALHRGDADPTAGSPSEGLCAGEPYGDGIARGYITVDVVDECSGIQLDELFSPAWGGYFNDGGGGDEAIAIVANRLWGDYFIVTPGEDFAQGSLAIPLWGDGELFTSSDELTFYGRFSGYAATDERVPLPDLWSSRFLDGGPFSGGTSFVVWRDVGTDEDQPMNCDIRPSWWPLGESFMTPRDEAGENPVFLSSTNEFFVATQRVDVSSLPIPYSFGRIQFGLADGPGLTNPRQAWVQTVMSAEGQYSLGMDATAVNERCGVAP